MQTFAVKLTRWDESLISIRFNSRALRETQRVSTAPNIFFFFYYYYYLICTLQFVQLDIR